MREGNLVETVVVGSGYGGSVVAARLAAQEEVLLLERGRRWKAEEMPRSLGGLIRAYRTERRNPLGLWEFRFGRGTGNAFATALGGASLVNYGITARPDPHVFRTWPVTAQEMAPYYDRALEVLSPSPAPVGDELADKAFLDRIEPGRRVDLVNTIDWNACTSCGHCVPGCREGAKRDLTRTYLELARSRGAQIRTECEVVSFEPIQPEGYRLRVRKPGESGRTEEILCRRLVLAAGAFGTLDLLHRVRTQLPTTPSLGRRMSMNGDALAFLYNTRHELSGFHGAPLTTSARLRFRDPDDELRSLLVMSGRVPKSMMRASGFLLACLADLFGRSVGPVGEESILRRAARRVRDLWSVREGGALSQSFMYKLDAQDSAAGVARFTHSGRAVVDWPDYSRDPILRHAVGRLQGWARRVGGTIVLLPGLHRAMKGFSVHTLGGCCMADTPDEGVVDPQCRVYRPGGGTYPGLHIVDATAVPSSLGVPPSLTISAIAERAAEAMLSASGP